MLTKFGNLSVLWDDDLFSGLMSFWPFRIDPFRVDKSQIKSIDLEIKKEKAEPRQTGTLLSDIKNGFYSTRVYKLENGDYCFQYSRTNKDKLLVELLTDSTYNNIRITYDESETRGMQAYEYIGQIIPYVMLNQNMAVFHGVLMEYNGKSFIISANSGEGKTTHARLWRDHVNALILNGDIAGVYKEDGRWFGFGLPWSGSSGEQINRKTPLAAFVKLEQAQENSVELIHGIDAFMAMYGNCKYPNWDASYAEKGVDMVTDLMQDIPVIRLKCLPDKESVFALKTVLDTLLDNYG